MENVLSTGWKIADADGKNHTSVHFEWEGDDLVLYNHDVKLEKWTDNSYYPSFFINANLAVDMGWFKDLGNNKYGLGSNLTIEIPDGVIPTPLDITNPLSSAAGDKLWSYGTDSSMIRMTLTCNWRFTNLNTSFKNVLGATKLSLFVYSDVGVAGSWAIRSQTSCVK